VRIPRVVAAGLIVALTATPASALSGRLGAQVAAVGNELTGELPGEGHWNGSLGLGASLVAEFDLADDVALSFQPGFMVRSCRQEFRQYNRVTGYLDYEFDYLSLPLLVRVTGDPVGTRGFVTAGLDLGILIDAMVTDGEDRQEIDETLRPTTLGALFGAGIMIPLGRHFLTLELRYSQGLRDMVVRDGSETDVGFTSPSVKYRGLSLVGGFAFSLGGE
jgi:hypothetical protein